MNQSDAKQKPVFERPQKPNVKPKGESDEVTQEEIDKYMRMVGRMLYDIILDWVKKQEGRSPDTANQALDELASSEGKDL